LCVAVLVSFSAGCRKPGWKSGSRVIGGGEPGDVPGLGPANTNGGFDIPVGPRPGDGSTEWRGEFSAVYFDYDSSSVQASQIRGIEAVAAELNRSTTTGVIVEGHCDERGSREYNVSLGERRAQAIRAHLIGAGVDPSRVQTKSLGEEKPVAFGHDEASWSQNRRGEFVFLN